MSVEKAFYLVRNDSHVRLNRLGSFQGNTIQLCLGLEFGIFLLTLGEVFFEFCVGLGIIVSNLLQFSTFTISQWRTTFSSTPLGFK